MGGLALRSVVYPGECPGTKSKMFPTREVGSVFDHSGSRPGSLPFITIKSGEHTRE